MAVNKIWLMHYYICYYYDEDEYMTSKNVSCLNYRTIFMLSIKDRLGPLYF